MPVKDIIYKVKEYLLTLKAKLVPSTTDEILASLSLMELEKLSPSRFNDKLILFITKRLNRPPAHVRQEAQDTGGEAGSTAAAQALPTIQVVT